MKDFLQGGAIMACLFGATLSHADVKSMAKIYNSPQTAPKTQRCKGNQNCNAFYALSKQWQSIPNNFTAYGDNIKDYARWETVTVFGKAPASKNSAVSICHRRLNQFFIMQGELQQRMNVSLRKA